ncbi:MAG: ferritin-like fold-containing protein [Nitriliruptorales bacterium]
MTAPQVLATVELLGALTYAQLRTFEVTAAAVRHAPDVRSADRVAEFAEREYRAYVLLRDRLSELTDLLEPAMERQKRRVDDFFDNLPITDWLSACTYFAIGLPIAADFARAVAPTLDSKTAAVVLKALAERDAFEVFASWQVTALVDEDPVRRERTRRLAAEITGSALTGFQGAVNDTDALLILLEQLEEHAGQDVLRHTAVALLGQHRRRMVAIGVDTLE